MGAPSTFQHSTAWAQVVTLLANVAVAVATLRVQVGGHPCRKGGLLVFACSLSSHHPMHLAEQPAAGGCCNSHWSPISLGQHATMPVCACTCVQPLHPHSFISFAFGPDLLSRFINLVLWALMTVKSVVALHLGTKSLLPRLPHLLVNVSRKHLVVCVWACPYSQGTASARWWPHAPCA